MITYYCPACWAEFHTNETHCPVCGYNLSDYDTQEFEQKLLQAARHPVAGYRYLAIEILGKLKSLAALPIFDEILQTADADVYLLRHTLDAVANIPGAESRRLLRSALKHPYPVIRSKAQVLLDSTGAQNLMTRIILVRHGQTEWNRNERFRGRADVPLNDTGLAQAAATGKRVARTWKPAAVYTSPLSRSVNTAQAIARHFDLPVLPHPDMADIDYGQWQGLTPDEARLQWPEEIGNWYEHPERAHIPGGESLDALRRRAMQVVQQLIEKHPAETIVLVGHTVINRVILLAVLGLGNERFWHLRQDTCAINVFEAEAGDFTLVSLNDTSHLDF